MEQFDEVTIAVDAVGGDAGADVVLPGVDAALAADQYLHILLCGPRDVVEPFAAAHDRCEAVICTQEIAMDEHPATAVRRKKDSSIVVGNRLVKEGRAQGFFSAGSTGACLAAATLVIGRIKGVARPALCTVIPSPVAPVFMCDVGANADCKPEYLLQFARMASIYVEQVMDVPAPRVGLLNIGSEDTKGSQFAQDTFALLSEKLDNFAGNAEGGDVVNAVFDVIVTDGFTGNVFIKTVEGTSKVLFSAIKGIMTRSVITKLGAVPLMPGLRDLRDSVSPDTYGGAPLLGVNGACVVGHGSSNATAVCNGIGMAARTVRSDVRGLIAQSMGH